MLASIEYKEIDREARYKIELKEEEGQQKLNELKKLANEISELSGENRKPLIREYRMKEENLQTFQQQTKEEVLEKILEQEKPSCPHCKIEMNLWEVPPVNVGDGLGWGEPYLYICFNDECPMYKEGWENMRENYGRNSSYRCMRYPGQDSYECMPVFSPEGDKIMVKGIGGDANESQYCRYVFKLSDLLA